jgi:aryl-alcohol dehydrogenase-like predicted oxidoreductase
LHDPPNEVLASPATHELLGDLVRERKVAHVGVSATSVADVEAALAIPAVTVVQVSSTLAKAVCGTTLPDRIRDRKIGIFVREILRKPDSDPDHQISPAEALAAALAPPFVTAAIVGVSTRAHLSDFLPGTA